MIPKRIIQTGRSLEALSPRERECRESLTRYAEGFEILFLDDSDADSFVHVEFADLVEVLDAFPMPIQKWDMFRYLAVYRLGGFYLDLDVELLAPLTDLTNFEAVFPYEKLTAFPWLRARGIDWQLGNYAFGARAEQAFIGKLVERCTSWIRHPTSPPFPWWMKGSLRRTMEVYYSTGPGLISRTFLDCRSESGQVTVLLPERIAQYNRFGQFGIHRCVGSWKGASRLEDTWLKRANRLVRADHLNSSWGELLGEDLNQTHPKPPLSGEERFPEDDPVR